MTTELVKSLEKLGLNEKESQIYLAAIKLGHFSVLGLSEKTGIKRPTCYLVLEELRKKGLITTFPKAKKVLYVAEHPNNLLKKTEESYKLAKELMPELQDLIASESEKPVLKVYTGQKGIQNIYEDILDEGKTTYYIASAKDLIDAVGSEFLDDWIKRRIAKGMQTVSVRIAESEIILPLYVGIAETLRKVRYAPAGFKTPYTIFIYGKKVAFISTKKDLFGFIVESADLGQTMKALFDVLWNISKEYIPN
ncbi:hypothetical protein A3A09_01530 [Candidatus Nomurabacteria bacterium RIFCSPLOWO2_01_FULL_42_20]|uniref:Transcription regulator TrmB N-terminal domain-containing protein n=1 Tax=Candidatus Nomurabacteria bacterium RIFCSPHIGHO2_01_FULL_42_16 TaxID=1801743 RepID=A0A1F6VI26_9BACT|nr:MAG: hypothetical protein A2824_01570 [Candidatus Nomurabacteria bacterium RIFCSPHIGHO2_01_FULL_42_16]OGI92470.1 MAG: hypothetical protein A3A09_01530 [Candidatus Nomurabacteria bacterium RIFCSPLOWO2_01_FULL_42_20]